MLSSITPYLCCSRCTASMSAAFAPAASPAVFFVDFASTVPPLGLYRLRLAYSSLIWMVQRPKTSEEPHRPAIRQRNECSSPARPFSASPVAPAYTFSSTSHLARNLCLLGLFIEGDPFPVCTLKELKRPLDLEQGQGPQRSLFYWKRLIDACVQAHRGRLCARRHGPISLLAPMLNELPVQGSFGSRN